MIDTAMLMAAGLGKRMRPLTATRPKPLVKVAGKPLMDHALDRLEAGGIRKVIVNVHYLADTVEAHLRTRKGGMAFAVSNERAKLLETGGGLIHAAPLLGDKPFFCANSDNLWIDGPQETLGMMQRIWNPDRMDALLLLVPLARAHCHTGQGDFHMDASGRLTRRKTAHVAPFVFTGVQIMSPALLRDPPGDVFSTNIFWDRAIEAGRLYGVSHQGLWFDVGTPKAIPVVESMITHG
ncbi:MAG: nucleotidyltransferase family protein [Pseudomonadota bacterium]|uniref:Nucleotidyltransferase family protein n=1 Tax=Sphingobium xenophagum TaxID=121428 RepID=A0A249MVV1_SPHXE|nr:MULTISPECIES: nucleotidyltransferase family protein [Sphingobium]ASY45269.1 nucleotidyltransferase family protein [Sphingobium xenophagum]OUC54681.1 mannose-1-phosphate guanylyltransferase [Sphingobium sp. GW456-12-10-14-TSB1]QWT14115.1 nucleotidyltransferase family protein [Sphingobium xenophagum]|tara:strand:- start:1515 stop:2225 length:711 start_codon:yes stop_codon:yes gene_type:complete